MSKQSLARRLIGIPWPPLLGVALVVSLSVTFIVRRAVHPRDSQARAPLMVLISGDTQGLLHPGDCGPGLPGGLARRATILKQAQALGPVLYAELGNAAGGISAYDRLTFGAILRGEAAMGVAAHNLGPSEIHLGAEELHRLASEIKVPFVCTNVRDAQDRPLAEPLRLVEIAGRRIAIAGFVSRSYVDESLEVLDPAAAIASALGEKRAPYDTLLVLAYLPADELSQLAARLPAKAVLIGPSTANSLETGNGSVAGTVGQHGRSLVRIDFREASNERWIARDIVVAPGLLDDPQQIDNLAAYHQDLAKSDFTASAVGLSLPLPAGIASTAQVAGTNACRACHLRECADWDASRHSTAWQSLWNRGVYYDPACQRCHTTGYGWEGGFQSVRSMGTWNVGCESCHGPSMAHVLNPGVHTPLVANEQCVTCHDADRSPGFDYNAAWSRIQHGRSSAAKPIGLHIPFQRLPTVAADTVN